MKPEKKLDLNWQLRHRSAPNPSADFAERLLQKAQHTPQTHCGSTWQTLHNFWQDCCPFNPAFLVVPALTLGIALGAFSTSATQTTDPSQLANYLYHYGYTL